MRHRTLWGVLVACLALALTLAPAAPAAQAWQPGAIQLTIDRGQGATYAIGDPITITFTLPQPGFIRLTSRTANGTNPVAEGFSGGTTGAIRSVVGDPPGEHRLRMELIVNNTVVATGETFFNATTGGSSNTIACNQTVSGQLASATDQERWTFSGSAGTRIGASVSATTPVQLTLQAPSGIVLATGTNSFPETTLTADGTYALLVGGGGQFGAQVVIPYQLRLFCSGGTPPPPPTTVTYQVGWNLVGAPTGVTYPVQLYQYDPIAGNYRTIPAGQAVQAGQGYWAYFTQQTSVNLAGIGQTSVVVTAPALQWVQVANPSGSQNATVTGADAVYTWDPVANQYSSNNTLRPGQGAWAIKYQGGAITISTQ